MLSNATSTACTSRRQRNGRQGENDERPLVGPPGRARPALPRGGVIQSVQVRRARDPPACTPARRMARARRARDGGRGPPGRPGRSELDAGPDPTRRRRARPGNPSARRSVRAVFAQSGRSEPDGLGRRDGAADGLRGLRAVRTQAAGLIGEPDDRSRAVHAGSGQRGADTKGRREADAPKLLEYNWGGFDMRWQLEALGGGTRLTLWTNIDRRFMAMGAAGWHICFDVLDHLLSGTPIGRIVGPEAMKFAGWQRLNAEYAKQFGH